MTINKIKTNGWFNAEVLTSDQINDIDENSQAGIDKRDGYSDTVDSTLELDGSIEIRDLTLESGCTAVILDGNDGLGKLAIPTEINGNINAAVPMRFGLAEIALSDADYTLVASEFSCPILRFSGSLTYNRTITIPNKTGAQYIVDNKCDSISNNDFSDGYALVFSTGAVNKDDVVIHTGCSGIIYVNDGDVVQLSSKRKHQLIEVHSQYVNSNDYTTVLQTVTNGSAIINIQSTALSGPTSDWFRDFTNVSPGDIFEVSYTAVGSVPINDIAYILVEFGNLQPAYGIANITNNPTAANQPVSNHFIFEVTESNYADCCPVVDQEMRVVLVLGAAATTVELHNPISWVIRRYSR